MSKVLALYHVVFATKRRQAVLHDSYREDMHAAISSIVEAYNSAVYSIGSVADHVHILLNLSPDVALSAMMSALKSRSSLFLKQKDSSFVGWCEGYYACSVSPSAMQSVSDYISTQAIHHSQKAFGDEVMTMCTRWGLKYHPMDLL